ncbi:ABC transporter permease subunit/CPBP intramembrane protease [Peptostreptococcus equinus]|uniref:ABC transporter permease subunit n=1 Tax=Peptostreptococcus equinus TaxID=3003601 RepID=A0ABY7JMC2_9FIRM|nr:ABC transporter permease subunit/CPBP intramembrane protease [Peptostreptococcus sp. CBA3647]WAW13986.1 ABC transporter permease subunit [Peptostreptococcus sp. CBA3647]
MNFSIVRQIVKKELLELIRDKKNLFMMLILPILIYPILMIGMSQVMMLTMNDLSSQDINLAVSENVPEDFINYVKASDISKGTDENGKIVITNVSSKNEKNHLSDVKNEKLDAYINLENKNYKIYLDTTEDKASVTSKALEKILDSYKEKLVENTLKKANLNTKSTLNPITFQTKTVAEKQEEAGSIIGRLLPVILITSILTGAIYPAVDIIAGEKERGTLETLFTLPIKNIELISGKYIAVATTAIITALMNIISLGLTMLYSVKMTSEMSSKMIDFNLEKMLVPLLLTMLAIILFVMVVTALSMCICSFSKSYKEAQNSLTPLMLVIMIPSYASIIPTLKLNTISAMIPVVNISLLIKSVFSMESTFKLIFIVLISTLVFIGLALVILGKIFNSESILFGDDKGLSILNIRSNIKKGNMPTKADGVLIFLLELVALVIIGSYLQLKFGHLGIALSQIILLLIVMLYAWYIKIDYKNVFKLNKFSLSDLLIALLIWSISFVLVIALTQLMMYILPNSQQSAKELSKFIINKEIWVNILVVALMPAICEELLFRGFILSSFSKDGEITNSAIIITGLLFGILHLYLFKILPIAVLGMALSLIVKKTKSIIPSMSMHFLNNLISVLASMFISGMLLL